MKPANPTWPGGVAMPKSNISGEADRAVAVPAASGVPLRLMTYIFTGVW